jgi:hypothetical protein
MAQYWRPRQPVMARMHTMARLPKELNGEVSMRPEDRLLLVSHDGNEIITDGKVNLKDKKFRKTAQAVMFYSSNAFPIMLLVTHRFPGTPESRNGEVHFDVRISDTSSYLIRENLMSTYSNTNELDTLILSEIINQKLRPRLNDILGPIHEDELRDYSKMKPIFDALSEEIRKIISHMGFDLVNTPSLRWSETSKERLFAVTEARRNEIIAKTEIMKVTEEARMAEAEMAAQKAMSDAEIKAKQAASDNLIKHRREYAQREIEFLQAQMVAGHEAKMAQIQSEREIIQLQRQQEMVALRNSHHHDQAMMDMKQKLDLKYADEERKIQQEKERFEIERDRRAMEIEEFARGQEQELQIHLQRRNEIELRGEMIQMERDMLDSTNAIRNSEREHKRKDDEAKMDKMERLLKIKAMNDQRKIDRERGKLDNELHYKNEVQKMETEVKQQEHEHTMEKTSTILEALERRDELHHEQIMESMKRVNPEDIPAMINSDLDKTIAEGLLDKLKDIK